MNNLIQIIKDFLAYRKSLSDSQMIDTTLEDGDKIKLGAFDRELVQTLYYKTLQRLTGEMLKGELSSDYINWAKLTLKSFKENFKDYKIK